MTRWRVHRKGQPADAQIVEALSWFAARDLACAALRTDRDGVVVEPAEPLPSNLAERRAPAKTRR